MLKVGDLPESSNPSFSAEEWFLAEAALKYASAIHRGEKISHEQLSLTLAAYLEGPGKTDLLRWELRHIVTYLDIAWRVPLEKYFRYTKRREELQRLLCCHRAVEELPDSIDLDRLVAAVMATKRINVHVNGTTKLVLPPLRQIGMTLDTAVPAGSRL